MIEHVAQRNFNYEEDIRYSVQVHRLILRLIGIWPFMEKPQPHERLLRWLLKAACLFLLFFSLIPLTLHIFLIMDTFKARLKMFGPFCFYIMSSAMYCTLMYREDRIEECVRYVEEDWRNVGDANDRRIMLKKARDGRYIQICSTIFVFTIGFTYRLIQPIVRGTVVKGNVTIRPLVQGHYYVFFDPQRSPAYEIVFSINCLAGIFLYLVLASVCGITILLAMHACGQLEVLASWLNNLTNKNESWTNYTAAHRLALIVTRHARTRKFLHQIQGVVGEMCFFEIIGCTLILCLLGYYVITEWKQNDSFSSFTYAIMLVSFTFNIFILCYIGEILNTQGNKVNTTCCTIDWYYLPGREARYLILVIIMASYPTKIRASKFIDLSLSSFGAVVRTAMAYLNLLRAVTL